MDQPLSILHVLTSLAPRYGGPPRIAECCAALASLGHHVELVSTALDGPRNLAVPAGVPVERDGFVATAFPVPALRRWALSPGLGGWLWRNVSRFDVVHLHGVYGFTTTAGARACRYRRVPYVMQPHGAFTAYHRGYHRIRKRLYEFIIEASNVRAATTIRWESERERNEGVAAGWPSGVLVPQGIWLPDPPKASERRQDMVAFLGRLSKKKGADIVIDAFARVLAGRPNSRLRIAGPDQDVCAAALRRHAETLGISDRVQFDGLLVGAAKDQLLREASVFAFPSADESFGVATIEAMAYGAPVVVTASGTPFHAEFVTSDAAIVCERDPQSVADALLRVLGSQDLASRLARNGRSLVADRFTWGAVAGALEAVYRKVLSTHSLAAEGVAASVEGS